MPELENLSERVDKLVQTLDRLAAGRNELCDTHITGGVATDAYSAQAELEEIRTKAETLRRDLAAIKSKGKLDPEVRDLESKLEQVLNRYYLLWQKCKDNMV